MQPYDGVEVYADDDDDDDDDGDDGDGNETS